MGVSRPQVHSRRGSARLRATATATVAVVDDVQVVEVG